MEERGEVSLVIFGPVGTGEGFDDFFVRGYVIAVVKVEVTTKDFRVGVDGGDC